MAHVTKIIVRGLLTSFIALAWFHSAAGGVPADQLATGSLKGARSMHGDPVHFGAATRILTDGVQKVSPFGGPIPGIDTIPNFTGQFNAIGVDWSGSPKSVWSYAMAGRSPSRGGTTRIGAPVIAVSVDLRDANGQPRFVGNTRLYSDATRYVDPVLNSPVFVPARYPGFEDRSQYADAVQRAEFYSVMGEEWHTVLNPRVGKPLVMAVSQDAACGTKDGNGNPGHCNYYYALNKDGSCCLYILLDDAVFTGLLYPPVYPVDNRTIIGAAELSGDMTTKDITSFLFPDTYLYDGDLSRCCILGYHSFDYEPGDTATAAPRFYVMNFSSWIGSGALGDSFTDITALSHEISEIFNDPFVVFDGVTNATPWWLAPNGNCQNNLEDGDVVEGLPNATYPVRVRGKVYHPQNEALLPWFAFQSPSSAIGGAYSYPDSTLLTSLSVPQNAGCSAPL